MHDFETHYSPIKGMNARNNSGLCFSERLVWSNKSVLEQLKEKDLFQEVGRKFYTLSVMFSRVTHSGLENAVKNCVLHVR